MTHIVSDPPAPPDVSSWGFLRELRRPLWSSHGWQARAPRAGEISVVSGIVLEAHFPDPRGLLRSAYADWGDFLAAGKVPTAAGTPLRTVYNGALGPEEHVITVDEGGCVLEAGDTEGIRRGIYHLEDRMLRAGGPFFPLGRFHRKPFITRRISRCFFGPIKRPPMLRDELMDEEDYYPEPYLERLAHEGVNGLWLTVEFRDLCRTAFTPEYGAEAERRFAKLQRTVDTCLRHGIRTYLFCIEPRAWGPADAAILERHPELGRVRQGDRALFCPFSDAAQHYLEEAVGGIFSRIPDLGGLINISHGERATTCLSAVSAVGEGEIRCPICSRKAPWEILHASLAPMERALHAAAPDADLISWLYMPQPQGFARSELATWVYDIPAHTPPGVTLQFNFESGVCRTVFGQELIGGDYWLSNPGPSDRFERVARAAREAGVPVSAKIQTGCSHEMATVPYVPIPGMIYRKFAAMRDLGVSASMLCWYFGNYPGVMNKAAGELSFEPFPASEEEFLTDLASLWWGEDAAVVAEAWRTLAAGYAHYPLTNLFQYYGPMHDGPVWPLHLDPVDAPLAPTWQLGSSVTGRPWPPSGDRIGEAFGEALTLPQIVSLCDRMVEGWEDGLRMLRQIAERHRRRDRELDLGLAEMVGICFRSGRNICRFYEVRERLLRAGEGEGRLSLLEELVRIVHDEIAGDRRLLELLTADSRLGFHSEAEGYKMFPAKVRWRLELLEGLLRERVPVVREAVRRGERLHPEYTGEAPEGPTVRCPLFEAIDPDALLAAAADSGLIWRECAEGGTGDDAFATRWALCRDETRLWLFFHCRDRDMGAVSDRGAREEFLAEQWRGRAAVALKLELRRLWPVQWFAVAANGVVSLGECGRPSAVVRREEAGWCGYLSLTFAQLGRDPSDTRPMRFDVQRALPGVGVASWMPQHPWTPRLRLGTENPRDLAWLLWD